jgi:hypothetical protein
MHSAFAGERGFSVLRLLFWLALIGFLALNGARAADAWYANSKVQRCFDSAVGLQGDASVIRQRLGRLFQLQYLDSDDLPAAFYDALDIRVNGPVVEISSHYTVTIWPFGRVDELDADGSYDPDALNALNMLRDRSRIDLDFDPYAITAVQDIPDGS